MHCKMSAVHLYFLICLMLWSNATIAQVQRRQEQSRVTPDHTEDGSTPLMHAAAAGRLDEVRSLLKSGADVNQKQILGITALMCAAGAGHLNVVKALLEAGADPNALGGLGHPRVILSVLTVAMNRHNKNRMEIIDTLIAAGAKVNPPPSFPESPLDAMVIERDLEMIRALLKRGADPNWENEIGRTPLVNALTDGNGPDVEVVRLLLEAGADAKTMVNVGDYCVSVLDHVGKRFQRGKNLEEIKRLLKRHGAKKLRVKAVDGRCP